MKSRALFLACALVLGLTYVGAGNDSEIVLGSGLSGEDVTAISDIVADPTGYDGKVVRVRGKIEAVCKNMGCWMDLKASEGEKIQIKVPDGVIVFPVSAMGREATAEGTVSVRELSRDEYVEWLQHVAEENGESFDPQSVGEPPYRMIRVMGTGAVIH